jgi:hypothetical protein
MREPSNEYTSKYLIGKTEKKRPFGGVECRWKCKLRMDLTETGCQDMGWIQLAPDRKEWRTLVNTE